MRIVYELLYVSPLVIVPFILAKIFQGSLKGGFLFALIGLFIGLYIAFTTNYTTFFTMDLDLFTASILFHINLAISGIIVGPIVFFVSSIIGKDLLADPPKTGELLKNVYIIAVPILYAAAGFAIGLVKTKMKG
jgi:hypothetical protein